MSQDRSDGMSAHIRKQLSQRSTETGENLTFILERFAAQQLLFRLSISEHRNSFALKGAQLLAVWSSEPYRATRDIDLLGWGETSQERLESVFQELCGIEVADDGLIFAKDTIKVDEIRENQEYGGHRVRLRAYLGEAWVNVQVDVGFGDAITPQAVEVQFPSMLDLPPARLTAYPKETVVAEKVEALVRLGLINGRMKDFSDLYYLASEFEFDGQLLAKALIATFSRRRTGLPQDIPVALTEQFYRDGDTMRRWSGFLQTARMSTEAALEDVCLKLRDFVLPALRAAASDADFDMTWRPDDLWHDSAQ